MSTAKKILLVGNAPLPDENTLIRPAAGLRTQQFLNYLKKWQEECGEIFNVKKFLVASPEAYGGHPPAPNPGSAKIVFKDDPSLRRELRQFILAEKPDAILAINTFPSALVAPFAEKFQIPFWADLNGWILAEAQTQCAQSRDNALFPHYFSLQKVILDTADRFSTVSSHQKWTLFGELMSQGLLGKENFGLDPICVLPNLPNLPDRSGAPKKSVLRERQKNFDLLFAGAYNNWLDVVKMFELVDAGLRHCPKMRFVSTGGGVLGLSDDVFSRFQKMVARSEFRDRYLFLGWLPAEDLPDLYSRSMLGLSMDLECLETATGARNRLNEMAAYGLPLMSTFGTEIAEQMYLYGALVPADLENLLRLYQDWEAGEGCLLGKIAVRGLEFTERTLAQEPPLALRQWLLSPEKFPKARIFGFGNSGVSAGVVGNLRSGWFYLKKNGWRKFLKKFRQKFF